MSYKFKDRNGKIRHMGQVRHPSFPNGKMRKSYRLKKDADAWEVKEKAKLNGDGPQDMDLEILSAGYLDVVLVSSSEGHYKEIRSALARFLQWLDQKGFKNPKWSQVDPKLAQAYFLALAQESSNNRANKQRTYLATFAGHVNDIEEIPGNPFIKTRKLKHDTEPQIPAERDEVDRLRLVAQGQDRAILEAYLGTAARRVEIYRWTWKSDIRLEQRQYRLGTRKSGGEGMTYEWLPMNDDLYEWLCWWKKNRPLELPYVFYSVSHTGGSGGGADKCYGKPFVERSDFIKNLSIRAGIEPSLGYHHLRRYVATILAENGHPIKAIQRFLRHRSLATTEKYVGHVNVDLEAMAQSLVRKPNESSAKIVGA